MRAMRCERALRRVLMLSSVTLILSGCVSLTGSGETEVPVARPGAEAFCDLARPITWSTRDTDETIRGVKSHNALGVRLCGWEGAE